MVSAIAHLANVSFTSGTFPAVMKHGLVTPLLKKPGLDAGDMKNFRPVTHLSTISKILERLVSARLKSHITASQNFCGLQSAYRKRHSTETALCFILDDIVSSIDDGHHVALMSLDISAAFDAVPHDALVHRLDEEFGISATCSQWIASYLADRSYSVRVGTSTSSQLPMSSGVPQGSVLGPMPYTAYMAPVDRLIASYGVHFHVYAYE